MTCTILAKITTRISPLFSSFAVESITEINYTCIKKLQKMYATDLCKIYTKCIPNLHKLLYTWIHFVYKIKRTMAAEFSKQNLYKSLLKCGVNFVYILYTSILFYKKCTLSCVWQTSFKMWYNKYMTVYMQKAHLFSTYLDLFIVHFLGNWVWIIIVLNLNLKLAD